MTKKGDTEAGKAPRRAARLKSAIAEALELPKEIVLNLPVTTVMGIELVNIENYKGVVEYNGDMIRIKTNCGIIRIEGKGIFIARISAESVSVGGRITSMRFI